MAAYISGGQGSDKLTNVSFPAESIKTSDWLVATTQTVNMSLVGQQELLLMQRNSLSMQSGINISPRPVEHENKDTRVFVTTWFKQSLFHIIYS